MDVNDVLLHLSRLVFFILAAATFLNYWNRRDPIRRDIFLTFACLSTGNFVQLVMSVLNISPAQAPWLLSIGQLAVVAQPFLMVWLVRYFRPVPRWIYSFALAGMVVCWAALAILGLGANSSTTTLVTLIIIAYFVVADGYAVIAFIVGAVQTRGVVRQRLRFAAAGSATLIFVLVLAGMNAIVPSLRDVTLPLIRLFSIICATAYYIGFAPPRWLRRAWQHEELRNYLQYLQQFTDRSLDGMLKQLYSAISLGVGSNVAKAKVALWDKDRQKLVLQSTSRPPDLSHDPHLESLAAEAWSTQAPVIVDKTRRSGAEDIRLLRAAGAETLIIVPIAYFELKLGDLIVFLEHGSLFADEDASLLAVFAQQMAVLLQHQNVLDELFNRNEYLERVVADRTADLQRSNEELKMFAYVASHDLQEPLRTISSYLQLIVKRYNDRLDDEGREFIAFAVDGAARMKELIEDVLMYSRVERELKNVSRFDSDTLVEEVALSLSASINDAGATVTHDDLPEISADRRLIALLFQNLISNALKYHGPENPLVHVSAAKENGTWRFAVKDNGIGMEKQYLEQIFVVFRRLHHRDAYPGTGIGLAVCKKAVELHGGRIWAESEPGKGSTFYFTLPA